MAFGSFYSFSQENYSNIKKGIKYFENKNYSEAEAKFRKVIENKDTVMEAYFNLGNAIYEQQRFEEARESYEKALVFSKTKIEMAEVSYNIGNTFMAEKKWEDAIKYYKQSLRNNSKDLDAKYNLAYAQEMLAEEQQQQEQNKDKEDQKDGDKKEEPKEEKSEDKKEEKSEDKKDKGEEKQDEEGKPKPQKLTKEEAERLLRAIESQEQKLQDKKKQEDMVPVQINSDKDW
tara:strand:+ start:936 stop:1628 length:693 start_codon:yes stop_codon:yes gene_type:complete